MGNRRAKWLLLALALAGCEHYEPVPLPAPAETAAPPAAADQLQSRVDELRHPKLNPVRIDLVDGLTPDSAAVLAVVLNPSLRAVRDQRAVACSQLLQAGLLPNPTFDFSIDPVTGGNTPGSVAAFSFGPSWEVTSLITHEAKVCAARAGEEAARLDVAWQEWQIAQAAKKAVYDLIATSAQAQQAREVDWRLQQNMALLRSAVQSHDRTLLDVAAAEAAADKAHGDALVAEHDLRQQVLALNRALGFPPDTVVKIKEMGPLPSRLALPPEKELAAGLENQRLDLVALRHGYESQEQTLRVAVLSQFPKIVLGFHQASDTTNVHTTGFGATIDLPIFDQQQGAIAKEKATRQQLFDEYTTRLFDARSAIAQSLADIHSLQEQIAAGEAALPALQRLVNTYELAVNQHNADILSYYNSRNDLAQKRIDILKLKQQLLDNQIALELASGRYLPRGAPAPAKGPTTAEARR